MIAFNLKAFGHNDSSDITGGSLAHIEVLLDPSLLQAPHRACHPAQAPVSKTQTAAFRLTT